MKLLFLQLSEILLRYKCFCVILRPSQDIHVPSILGYLVLGDLKFLWCLEDQAYSSIYQGSFVLGDMYSSMAPKDHRMSETSQNTLY